MKENATKEMTSDSTISKIKKYHYDSYDDKGIRTQRAALDENGMLVSIVRRTITYYAK